MGRHSIVCVQKIAGGRFILLFRNSSHLEWNLCDLNVQRVYGVSLLSGTTHVDRDLWT